MHAHPLQTIVTELTIRPILGLARRTANLAMLADVAPPPRVWTARRPRAFWNTNTWPKDAP
jgi:hypothetical protein